MYMYTIFCRLYVHVYSTCTCVYTYALFMLDEHTHRQRGCDIDAKNDYGQTPLHMALARGNTRSAEKLVTYGASVNAMDQDGCSPLHYVTSKDGMEPPTEDTPVIFKVRAAELWEWHVQLY